jgi:hypothetical protein
LHKLSSSFVLGYHGCDRSVAEELLSGTPFVLSENEWDWLGHGIYFWEANPLRGLEFAKLLQRWRSKTGRGPEITDPYVVGAVVDLGFCLDLLSSTGTQAVASAYHDFLQYCTKAGVEPPRNVGGPDALFRVLDCAVINHLHSVRKATDLDPFDTVRGAFMEGGTLYPGSGFYQKTHMQICVRNVACIKGVFRVPTKELE